MGRGDGSNSGLGQRLKQARVEAGLTQKEAGQAIWVDPNTIYSYETDRVNPSGPALRSLVHAYDKPYEWFFGKEEKPQRLPPPPNDEAPESGTQPTPESSDVIVSLGERLQDFSARFDRLETYIRAQAPVQAIGESRPGYGPSNYDTSDRSPVRLLEVASAAGVGAEVYDETPIGLLWFRNDWLLSHSIDPEKSNIIRVRGESMEPTLPDGCSILVDRSQGRRRRRVGRIFVMRTEDGLVVKRAGKDAEGNWQMESDNEDWEPVPWSRDAEIIGEVRWSAVTY